MENDKIIKELLVLSKSPEDAVKDIFQAALNQKMTNRFQRKENTEQYQKIPGISTLEVQQLVKLDKEIERLFEI
jgi:hypothetical protein